MARNILEDYELGEVLGKGGYSEVRKAIQKSTGRECAMKIIDKTRLTVKDAEGIESEIKILSTIDHPNIIKLIDHGWDLKRVYIVMELCEGGELFDRIVKREFYSETDAQEVLSSIASALQLCHSRHIVHRDLKPENILMLTPDVNSPLKIADFGFAKQLDADDDLTTALGTPNYIAPEVLKRNPYDTAVDMWALGVIAYILLCGYPPFYAESPSETFEKIKKCQYKFDSPYWDNISEDAKDLIRHLLVLEPSKRLTIDQVLSHPWMKQSGSTKDITPALSELRAMLNRRKLKRGIGAVMAINKIKLAVRSSAE